MPEIRPKALVIGGSGFIGAAVAAAFAGAGYAVSATSHSDAGAARLTALGYVGMAADIAQPGPWLELLQDSDVVIYAAQERAGTRLDAAWLTRSRSTRDAAMALIFEALSASKRCTAFLYTSAIAVLGNQGNEVVEESTPRKHSPIGDFHAESEVLVLDAARRGLPGIVIRPGFVYGPGGTFAEFFIKEARKGFYPYPGHGRNYLPWVHVDDLARAYVPAAKIQPIGEVIHVVDNEPLQLSDFAKLLMIEAGGGRSLGMPRLVVSWIAGAPLVAMLTGSYRATNRRAASLLGWSPSYPTAREGLPAVFAAFDALELRR